MTNPERIVVIVGASQLGKTLASQISTALAPEVGKVLIVDEYPNEIPDIVKQFMLHPMSYDFPEDIVKPKSEFEKRQEWLDGFRAQHQKRARRSRK